MKASCKKKDKYFCIHSQNWKETTTDKTINLAFAISAFHLYETNYEGKIIFWRKITIQIQTRIRSHPRSITTLSSLKCNAGTNGDRALRYIKICGIKWKYTQSNRLHGLARIYCEAFTAKQWYNSYRMQISRFLFRWSELNLNKNHGQRKLYIRT